MELALDSDTARVQELFGRQRLAFRRQAPPPVQVRLDRVARLRSMVVEARERLFRAVHDDFGAKSREEFAVSEVATVVQACDHMSKHLRRWSRPWRVRTSWRLWPGRSRLHPQPLGVVGIVSPWNYPVYLSLVPLVGALAAGNRVMLKPSEFTPHTSDLLLELLDDAFGDELVGVVPGGVEIAEAFCRLPFDHLLFTGSTEVGRKVMMAAAENLTPVTLELGGKSPAVLSEDVFRPKRIHRVCVSLAIGKLINAGQTCIAPDHVWIPRRRRHDFVDAFTAAVRELYPTLLDNPDYTGILQERHFDRLTGWLREAREAGVEVISLEAPGEEFSGQKAKLAPTLLVDPPDHLAVMQNEIFGPILPIKTMGDVDEAIEGINRRPRPLAMYVFSDDRRIRRRLLSETWAGGVSVNETLAHCIEERLPFGGVGASGLGSYHGEYSFRTFSHMKPVFTRTALDPMKVLRPPYGDWARRILDWLIR
jgi:coniferyl-aldehyde dehydrogenase